MMGWHAITTCRAFELCSVAGNAAGARDIVGVEEGDAVAHLAAAAGREGVV
jgi:hypothetical protein